MPGKIDFCQGLNPSEIYQKCYESNSKDMVLFRVIVLTRQIFSIMIKSLIQLCTKRFGKI